MFEVLFTSVLSVYVCCCATMHVKFQRIVLCILCCEPCFDIEIKQITKHKIIPSHQKFVPPLTKKMYNIDNISFPLQYNSTIIFAT